MDDSSSGPETGKARKRTTAKPVARSSVSKVKSTIHLTRDASVRLDIHCAMMDMDRSELVEFLINQHLRRFVVSDRGGQDVAASGDTAA
jgi:hypothetical protein